MENCDAHNDLTKLLDKNRYGISCAHLNVNGLFYKLDEIKILLHSTKLDVLTITETHLHDEIENKKLKIQDYCSRWNRKQEA